MSFWLLQFSPAASTRIIRIRAIPLQWCTPSASAELGFLKAWLEDDDSAVSKCMNWGAICGLALSLAVSAGCWTGLALIVGRMLK